MKTQEAKLWAFNFPEVTDGRLRLKIVRDTDAANPRQWDNFGTMSCFHAYYTLGDPHDYRDAGQLWHDLAERAGVALSTDTPTAEERAAIERKFVLLPLYLYDHSGLSINTTGFSCPWDSGQIGLLYADIATLETELGSDYKRWQEVLRAEVETYDQFLQDDVWGFLTERAETCDCCGHTDWVETDAVWGFYGSDISANGLYGELPAPYRHLLTDEN